MEARLFIGETILSKCKRSHGHSHGEGHGLRWFASNARFQLETKRVSAALRGNGLELSLARKLSSNYRTDGPTRLNGAPLNSPSFLLRDFKILGLKDRCC